ncbi:SDR family oxidoreductase [Methylotenera sp.]|uniref:UDP-glucose 4-epimerase family protein n=1 Tax=Methylotenera sp. TaxID=2051956 RepID=UPI0027346CA7|nr:SDR family oxidoreductase [Methylotenera sp.]MDP3211527.1 SDR family oxidoreductase [Methylotenera sp.]
MTILVTGANGFVGNFLIRDLRKKSQYQLVGAVRNQAYADTDIRMFSVGDIDAVTDWSVALDTVNVVVHLAARVHIMNDSAADPLSEFRKVNLHGTLNLARQAVKAGVKRFVFVSSIKVNGESTQANRPFTASDTPCPHDDYGISKYEAEQELLKLADETGMEVVVIRPPLIYGAGVKANFANMMRAVKRGTPLPLGAIHNKRSFVYIGNLVSLIVRCVDHHAAANQVFLVSDGDDLSTTELLRACASALQVKSRLLSIPQRLLEAVATIIGKRDIAQRLCANLQVDITKTRTILGWSPPISVVDGLRTTAESLSETNNK